MDTPTDNSSLDESSQEEPWPDYYFDQDGETAPSSVDQVTTSAITVPDQASGSTAFLDLPHDILRKIIDPLDLQSRYRVSICNKALQAAIGSWRWAGPGDGTMEVVSYGWVTCGVNLGGVFRTGNLAYHDAVRNMAKSILPFFPWFSRLYDKLHLKVLRMRNVRTLISQPNYAEFFDNLVVNDLVLELSPDSSGLMHPSVLKLIGNSRNNVVIQVDGSHGKLEMEEFLAIERPVTLAKIGYPNQTWSFPTEIFLKLADQGHSLFGFMPLEFCVESLAQVIEKVSASSIRQRIDIRAHYDICKQFVDSVQARRERALDDLELAETDPRQDRAFEHLGAVILLRSDERAGMNSRVIIASQATRDECSEEGSSVWEMFKNRQ